MKKNLVVFYTDQQRRDSLGCYGNPVARTPNIDALAGRGMVMENHYVSNPVCMPSRASFFTGRHLQAHRLLDNGIALPEMEVTLPAVLSEHGYRTCAVGKIHLTPYRAPLEHAHKESWELWNSGALDGWSGPYYGFETVELTLGHGDGCFMQGGHYGRWVEENFGKPELLKDKLDAARKKNPYHSALPVEAHHSTWVADRTIEYIRSYRDEPFFIFVSFPDPHAPFTPPEPYASMFENCNFPNPYRKEGENDRKPVHYRRAMTEQQHPNDGQAHRPDITDDELRKKIAATYGMVSLIDHNVGRVLKCLEECGLMDNTTVVFTSDHGELLGDHWFIYKGPYPCRSLLNVAFVIADRDVRGGKTRAVTSNVDVMPTLLELLDVPVPPCVQGESFKGILTGSKPDGERTALSSGWSKDSRIYYHHSLYESRYRISYYPNQDDGELYDLENDQHEFDNLYHEPEFRKLRDEMLLRLLRKLGEAEPPSPPVIAPW